MAAESNEIDVRPEFMLIEQVLDMLGSGRLRVPKFQRPFVWRPEQMLSLFDSIERGYPIGSLLFWETVRTHTSLDVIGDQPIPQPPDGRAVAYILDGHQRLSTLFATLRRPAGPPPSQDQRDWMWWPYRVLGESDERANRYRHWKRAGRPPANWMPLRSVLRTIDFLGFARDLAARAEEDMDVEELTSEAELVAQRIKSYKMAVVRLIGGSLESAVEVFSRVNSTGQAMRPAQMVSALTYQKDGQQSLADRLDRTQEMIADTGFGEVSSDAVFRALLAISGEENVQEARWDVLAQRVKNEIQEAADHTEEALGRAVDFLRGQVQVPLARLIPYDAQLMLLTTFFHFCPEPTEDQAEHLTRWFWVTSWTGHFAGANSTQIKQALSEMKAFAHGIDWLPVPEDRARPFPNRFDLRSARVRAFIIWELLEFPRRLDADGEHVPAEELLARAPTSAYRQVVVRAGLLAASSPANRLILPTVPRQSVRHALLNLPDDLRESVLESHGIPVDALELLRAGKEEEFIEARRAALAERERSFMAEFLLFTDTDSVGEADIDTT